MTLDPAGAADIALAAVEDGAGVATVLGVGAHRADAGARIMLVRDAEGRETVHGSLGSAELDAEAVAAGRVALADPRHRDGLRTLSHAEVYLEVRRPVRDLIVVGAGHIARPVARMGADLGYRVWVLDDRPDFATRERFPEAYRVVKADFSDPFRDVPIHPRTHVLLVTRGHKYDYDCLVDVLRRDPPPAYIGMIGSRRRVRATFTQLLEDGIPRARLGEIHAPVGLDIGAETPEEIAVAVAAELVKVHRGGSGTSLRDLERVSDRFFGEDAGPDGDPDKEEP
ncbi:MAG: XdhC family protein [Gemmatimonadetes bacterium]|nr:XdhC family protein [Gemmatimonadota bacterium]